VRVPVGQSQELYRTLKAAGVATGLVLYPREGHGVAEPRHRIDMIKRILAWFRTHLGKDGPDR
jgi:dipeptidyl aminopeptidase/acylaminoacyl peptidase